MCARGGMEPSLIIRAAIYGLWGTSVAARHWMPPVQLLEACTIGCAKPPPVLVPHFSANPLLDRRGAGLGRDRGAGDEKLAD